MSEHQKTAGSSEPHEIDPDTYFWTYHAMDTLFKLFKLTVHTHGDESAWKEGHIFLFNHFARFETFFPQYLIYEKTGAFSKSIAAKELFNDDLFGQYLSDLGGIPTDSENLMYRVSKDVINNHKLVAFPEGGIVKDRRAIDKAGHYSIFSRSDNERRKHHTGPAVIALTLAIFKSAVLKISTGNRKDILNVWAQELEIDSPRDLIALCEKPTLIIPCNITFYPLRIGSNILKDSVEYFYKDLHDRLSEELLIEGNLLLKDTDMDIQLGTPIVAEDYWTKIETTLTTAFINYAEFSLNDIFSKAQSKNTWDSLLFRLSYQRNARQIRDAYMHEIYDNVTINIAHIAASIIMHFVAEGKARINKRKLHMLMYFTIKGLQNEPSLNFHRTLENPSIYRNLLMTKSETFNQFLRSSYQAKLIENKGPYYQFSDQITQDYAFDDIRLKNPMAVYANEVTPIKQVKKAIGESIAFNVNKNLASFADKLVDDELRELAWDKEQFIDEKFLEINKQQTFNEQSAIPYRLIPKKTNGECVVLTHGLLSTPEEMRSLGDKLFELGYIVIGCRLKGHGTSPWDLHQRTWEDWRQSIRQSIKIAHCHSQKVHLIGFSSGALLSLMMGANRNLKITSVTACSAPIHFKDPLIHFVKVADTTNKIIQKVSWSEGLLPLMENAPEHPHLNYQHIPIAAIHQLLKLITKTQSRLKNLTCPVFLIQGDNDPVIEPTGMNVLLDGIPESLRTSQWVKANHHGILYKNTGDCQQSIIDFIKNQAN